MKDPYILKDDTLKNLLGITDFEELRKAETDISFVKLLDVEDSTKTNCDIELMKNIHKHIFGDIYEWAGEFRTIPLHKEEDYIIPGLSLEYEKPEKIQENLEKAIKEMNECEWEGKNIEDISKQMSENLTKIWKIHPFRDGNTRTTLTFGSVFAKANHFEMDMGVILNNLIRQIDPETGRLKKYSIRDKFVLAALEEEHCPEPQHLENLIKQSIKVGIDKKIDKLQAIIEEER